jgi:hypothetical protein
MAINKIHMKHIFLLPLIIIGITACKSAGPEMKDQSEMASVSAPMPPEQGVTTEVSGKVSDLPAVSQLPAAVTTEEIHQKIIRNGNMTLKVQELAAARKQVDSLVTALGGYIGNETYNQYDQGSQYFLVIRIPAANFDGLVVRLEKGTGEVLSKDIGASDVTEEYVDLSIRLDNKVKFLDRYNELLKKAGTIKEMLEIEENIRKIEEEIESTKGRLRFLDNQVNYSTLNLTLTQESGYKYKARHTGDFYERLKASLHTGWKGFIGFILLMLKIWPFWILAVAGWIIFKRYKKRRKITTGFKKT